MRYLFLLASLLLSFSSSADVEQKIESFKFGTIKNNDSNMRNGPSEDYKIIAKFKKSGIPVQILHRIDNWYLVRDFENESGWIRVNNISMSRKTAMILNEVEMCRLPVSGSEKCTKIATLSKNVIVKIKKCGKKWCYVSIDKKLNGWVEKIYLWGA